LQKALLRKQTAVDQILASCTTMARILSDHGMDAHIDRRMHQQLQLCLDQLGGVSHRHITLQQHAVDYMRTVYNPNSMLWVRVTGVWLSLSHPLGGAARSHSAEAYSCTASTQTKLPTSNMRTHSSVYRLVKHAEVACAGPPCIHASPQHDEVPTMMQTPT
jgi:hypothetical protein